MHCHGWIRRSLLAALLATVRLVGLQAQEPAENEAPASKYLRVERNEAEEPLTLQTAIVHFTPAKADAVPLTVDLVGAVHVADAAYYAKLNELFDGYDVVLYELVAPEGTQIPKGSKPSGHPVAMLQNGLKDMLQLEHQLQQIDYTKKNFVHADMSPDAFAKAMADRKESFATIMFRMMGQAMAQQPLMKSKSKTSDIDLFAALFDRNRASSLKRIMAEQFELLDGMLDTLGGPQGSAIITERNKVALDKLAEQIKAGKHKIAIFYGAGHLGDMERRLVADFQLQRSGEEWLTAWNLAKAADASATPAKPDSAPQALPVPKESASPGAGAPAR